ncbi:MAG: histidinol phosphatase [Chitinophagaceae bacterium]|jgi:tyrosine-protein phosphatase YwqE|nr:histidinol phosphatase [Chitinophagaceae bacterium]
MFKSLFGKSQSTATPDFSFLGADMHSHLLPGLDDGLQTMDQTMYFMGRLEKMGYRKFICTPHILSDMHPNTPDTILPKLDEVREALAERGSNLQVEAAAEYMIDLEFEKLIDSGAKLLTFGDKNYILIEMSYVAPSPNFEKIIFNLQMKDIKPVFAHPERYSYFHSQFDKYERLIELGCLLQVNILSLSGFYGKEVKKAGELLFKKNMVSFLGTDMHHDRHLALLTDMAGKRDFLNTVSSAELLNKTLL